MHMLVNSGTSTAIAFSGTAVQADLCSAKSLKPQPLLDSAEDVFAPRTVRCRDVQPA